MTTIIKMKNIDLSALGLPSIYPFVDQSNADFAFDFRPRTSKLTDLAGKRTLTVYKEDVNAGITNVADPTRIQNSPDGLGIDVVTGRVDLDQAATAIPIDGSVQFSILVVGGLSALTPPNSTVAAAWIGSLFDWGRQGINANFGFGIAAAPSANTWASGAGRGVLVGSQSLKNLASSTAYRKHFSILTYDGTTWTSYNKTAGATLSVTNASLGISAPIPVIGGVNMSFGNASRTNQFDSATVSMYQLAKWPRVLTPTEITEQYRRSFAAYRAAGI